MCSKLGYKKGKLVLVHVMKAHWGSRGINPLTLNLGTIKKASGQIHAPAASLPGMDPRANVDGFGEEKIYCPCRDSNPGMSSP
jgi:hypothetical protein